MKGIKKFTALLLTMCMIIGLFSGCTSAAESKALYDAMVKAKTIKSCQTDMQFTLALDATGLSEQEQTSFAQVKAMLNGAKFTMNMNQTANADNTVAKAQANVNMLMAGMAVDTSIWVDMDLNGTAPKFKEIIKLPAMYTAMDPSMAGKEYMVMDFSQLMNTPGQTQSVDFVNTMKMTKEFQEKTSTFLAKYLIQYDPGFKFITDGGAKDITTPEGIVKAHIYKIQLDDKATKKLIRYTVNNMANNKDAMDFALEYMKLIQKFAVPTPGAANPADEFSKLAADFEKEKPALLAKFNKSMDEIENIQIIGAKGITLEYAIDPNGYIVSQSGNMDLIIDSAKLGKLESFKSSNPAAEVKPASAAVYNVGFNFSMLMYGINKGKAVEFPTITPANSINYADMLKKAGTVSPTTGVNPAPVPSPTPGK